MAGAIIAGSSTFFITQNAYSIVVGFVGGVIQVLIQNYVEKPNARDGPILSTFSWSLFGIQGFLGGIFATGYRDILNHNTNGTVFSAASLDYNPGYELLIAIISVGMGLGFGAIAGALISIVSGQTSEGHFEDGEYWLNSDCISYPREEMVEINLAGKGISHPQGPIEDEEDVYF